MATAGTTGDERWMAMVGWLTGYTPYGKGTLSVTVLTGLNCKGNNHKPGEPENRKNISFLLVMSGHQNIQMCMISS